jgi:hypothetical protein
MARSARVGRGSHGRQGRSRRPGSAGTGQPSSGEVAAPAREHRSRAAGIGEHRSRAIGVGQSMGKKSVDASAEEEKKVGGVE